MIPASKASSDEGVEMQWYIASFISHRQSSDKALSSVSAREYWCILKANSSDSAYSKALSLGEKVAGELVTQEGSEWALDGLSELLLILEPPAANSELAWVQEEVRPRELASYVKKKDELRAFSTSTAANLSDWYVCKLVLVEVHDTGTHGDSLLLWTNWHLILATNAESAYSSAEELGRQQASESGGHRCDGDRAHWEFKGLRDLIWTIDPPIDGGKLWFEEIMVPPDHIAELIPSRSKLGVFDWERRQRGSGEFGRGSETGR